MDATSNANLHQPARTGAITAARVIFIPDNLSCLPELAGRGDVPLERAIYDLLRGMSPDYGGGGWEYFQLSNGGFYMAPQKRGAYRIVYEGIGFDKAVSEQAAGIIACATAYSHLSCLPQGDRFVRAHQLLLDFIEQHPEVELILAALD
jgi:hypothetical protein